MDRILMDVVEMQGRVAAIAELIPEWNIRSDLDPKKLLDEVDNFTVYLRTAMKKNGL